MARFYAYTDGACSGNPGPGGWGALLQAKEGDRLLKERELKGGEALADTSGPVGALGVPLTSERSIAVDPDEIPLGAPVFLSTTQPLSNQPLQRLMVAQDTGSAVKGAVRADFYWGHGDAAGEAASRMKQRGEMWVLMPKTD